MKPGDKIVIKRSWWKQLTFRGRLYSLMPGKTPHLNRTERLNQWVQRKLGRI